MRSGDDYSLLKPAFSICLLDGVLWNDSKKVHHDFRFTDLESGRTLIDTRLIFKFAFETAAFREDLLASYAKLTWAVLPIRSDASSVGHVGDAASIGP